jgi:A/G-specific adenine glycosylase
MGVARTHGEEQVTQAGSDVDARGRKLREALMAWYRVHRRDLPWRRTRDPYAIWVAEVMLQQTTVAAVVPYWTHFLEELPTLHALAGASEETVLRLWSGLGYYRRARALHAAARAVVAGGGDSLPDTVEGLRELPGIGGYTAAAVGSIAFGRPAAVVDGNVVRVLARVDAEAGDPTRQPLKGRIERRAGELLDREDPGTFNQALMELGATVCLPRDPRCLVCPWRGLCRARASGAPERWPELPRRRAAVQVVRAALLLRDRRGRLLLRRIEEGRANAGLFDFPDVELYHGERDDGPPPERVAPELAERVAALARKAHGLEVRVGAEVARCRHGITHHRITAHLLDAEPLVPLPRTSHRWRRVPLAKLHTLPLTSAARKMGGALAG